MSTLFDDLIGQSLAVDLLTAALERQRGGPVELGRDDHGGTLLMVGRHTLRDRARADHGVFWWSRHRFCALLVARTSRGLTAETQPAS